jgi:hypothetical protein
MTWVELTSASPAGQKISFNLGCVVAVEEQDQKSTLVHTAAGPTLVNGSYTEVMNKINQAK